MEQKVLPKKILTIYQFYEYSKNPNWKENPFKEFKSELKEQNANINIKIASNISNLNFYIIDWDIDKRISPSFIIKYLKDVKLRCIYSDPALNYKITSIITKDKKWVEEEKYKENTNTFICYLSQFEFLQYSDIDINKDISESKFYIAYKILNAGDKFILRFEIVLNYMDIDQEIDLKIYINMISSILKAIYKKFKIEYK
jgi:hypothetical protein